MKANATDLPPPAPVAASAPAEAVTALYRAHALGLIRLAMSVADGNVMTGLALSPDGTRLAIAVAPGGGVQQVKLYPLRGGPARTWSGTGGTIGSPFATRSLSWPVSQRTLAFDWSVGQTTSVRLLDPGTAGGSLLAASRPAVTLGNTANLGQTLYIPTAYMIITPDGSAIVGSNTETTQIAKNGIITYGTGFAEFSTATGRATRIVGHWPRNQQNDRSAVELLWSGASGQVLIGMIHSAGRDWIGVVSGNKFTPLNAQEAPGIYDFGAW